MASLRVNVRSVLARTSVLFVSLFGSLGGAVAWANPASTVTSAGDQPAQAYLDYEYQLTSSLITRERIGDPSIDPDGGIPRQRDLEFHQFRHVLTPRVELGVVRNTWISAALPIIITQSRELELASGVARDRSSTLRDEFLPAAGFDARDPSAPPPGSLIFRGVSRSGLDQVNLGLNVAPMNQKHDDTKPTWKMGAELRLAIGSVMSFSANNPTRNTSVGRGVHELRLWTTVDRRFDRIEGWFGLYYQVPLTAKEDSLYNEDLGFGVTNARPPQEGGAAFGLEVFAIDDKLTGNRISVDAGARIVGHFEGREYSEMWEVFAFAGDSGNTAIAPQLVLDEDPLTPGQQQMNHPGITNTENYLETAGRFAVRAALGKHVRFAATVDVSWKTDHVITFADAGVDRPTCTGGNSGCEVGDNDVVNPGTDEVNPLHNQRIDLVGHRYHSQNNFGLVIGVEGQFLF
jgi:hypothetical protein